MVCCTSFSGWVQYQSKEDDQKSIPVLATVWFYPRTFEITSNQLQTGVNPFEPGPDEWYSTREQCSKNIIFSDQREPYVDENTLEALHNREEMK